MDKNDVLFLNLYNYHSFLRTQVHAIIKPNRTVGKTTSYSKPGFLFISSSTTVLHSRARDCHKAGGQRQDGIVLRSDLCHLGVRAPLVVQFDSFSELELGVVDVIRSQTDPMFPVPLVRQRLVRRQATAAGIQNRRLVRSAGRVRAPSQRVQFGVQERIVMGHVRILTEAPRKKTEQR